MNKDSFSIFAQYSDAVIIMQGGMIVYSNFAANELFHSEEIPKEAFPRLLIEGEGERLAGTVCIDGEYYPAIASPLDEYKIITVFCRRNNETEAFPELMRSIVGRLKSELSVMHTSSGLIRTRTEGLEDAKLLQYLAMLEHSCGKMARTATNATRLYMWGDNGESLTLSYFDLAELCAELVSTMNYIIDNRINISFEAQEREFPFYADAGKIEILLINLFSNSLKYTPDGGKILLTLKRSSHGALLSVSDNGEGIPKDIMANVFMRYKDGIKQDDVKSGIGFGLPIVQKIAVMHGGSAALQSREGVGTTVKILLPERDGDDILRSSTVEYKSSMNRILTELADVLGYEKYISRHMD